MYSEVLLDILLFGHQQFGLQLAVLGLFIIII
jgi:hypothetical protein